MDKPKILFDYSQMSKQEWLKHKQSFIGASAAAAVCGVSRYRTPLHTYLEMIGDLKASEDQDNGPAYWGNRLEPVVADEFSRRNNKEIVQNKVVYQHAKQDFMIATLDREIPSEKSELEVKTSSLYKAQEWEDAIPEEYMIQVQHQLAVTGMAYAYLAVLIGGQQYRDFQVPRDDEVIARVIELEAEFFERVKNRRPPALDGSDISDKILKYLFPVSKQMVFLPSPELVKSVHQFKEIETQLEGVQGDYDTLKNNIKLEMGEAESFDIDGQYRVSWKSNQERRIDTKRLKEERPEIYLAYSGESTVRRFSVKPIKDKA